MADETFHVIKEECTLDDILNELPNRVAKPTPTVKGTNLSFSKFLHQISDSLKDIHLVYTCLDVSSLVIALGTNVGNAFIYQRCHKKVSKVSSETKYTPTTCIRLAPGCDIVAFSHESGTFSVGYVDPPIHRSFDSLTAKDIHHKAMTCLEWSNDGLILYAGDCEGNISMSVVKISEGILQTAIIFKEDAGLVQLSYAADALLVSTTKRTLIWSFQSEAKTQVGEKERKTTGPFGGCFLPDSLQEPSKKLYASRPGQRIWSSDQAGKVSSTSVFKTLLNDKPPTIMTLSADDAKMNGGGQFGALLIYYGKFVVTWDHSHLWVLDLAGGDIIGCHSNLGKIRDVAVSGHEIFVLLNQRERFLQRFTLIAESLGPSSLDAVIATPGQVVDKPLSTMEAETTNPKNTESNFDVSVTETEPQVEQLNTDVTEQALSTPPAVVDDVFDRINSIPLDSVGTEIVFTATKRKKKKKKAKSVSPSVETTPSLCSEDSKLDNGKIPGVQEGTSETSKVHEGTSETSKVHEGFSEDLLVHGRLPETSKTTAENDSSPSETFSLLNSGKTTTAGSKLEDSAIGSNEQIRVQGGISSLTDKEIQSGEHLGSTISNDIVEKVSSNVPSKVIHGNDTENGQKMMGYVVSKNADIQDPGGLRGEFTDITNTTNAFSGADKIIPSELKKVDVEERCIDRDNANTPAQLGKPDFGLVPPTATRVGLGSSKSAALQLEQDSKIVDRDTSKTPVEDQPGSEKIQDGLGSTQQLGQDSLLDISDDYQILDQATNYLRGDSFEVGGSSPGSSLESGAGEKSSDLTEAKQDFHVPLLADTWSKRDLPTSQAIESLAVSHGHVFCVNARGAVYCSDPNTASCHGWEKLDWKAKQIFVDDSCNMITYLGKDNKAYIRGNVSEMHPLGSASFLIREGVAHLTSCRECSWVLTTDGGLWKASTSTLLEMKGDLKNVKIWLQEDPGEKLCQIVCYSGALWARTSEDALFFKRKQGGKKSSWVKVEEKKAKWLNMSDDGTIWIITPDDEIWFNPGYASGEAWYQVSLGQYIIDDPSVLDSTVNFFYSMGSAYRLSRTTQYLRHATKGLIQSTKDIATSLFKYDGTPKQVYCNSQSGVWLLDTNNALHACRGQVTGACWERVYPSGTAHSATWRQVSTGIGSFVWALQPNGELTCFHPKLGPAYNIEGPSSVRSLDFVTSSPHGVWAFFSDQAHELYVRDGTSESYPQGFAWVSLLLARHDIVSVRHISVGRITVWAVDNEGYAWIRIGNVDGEDTTVQSQAWVKIDGPANVQELSRIEVNAVDDMVWAVDIKGQVFAREGVNEDFLVGTGWREVSGTILKAVCLSRCAVYGLCMDGEIVCRFGVSATNCTGDYWKRIPGNFEQLSISDTGELWAIGAENFLYMRKTRCLLVKTVAANEGALLDGSKEDKGGQYDDGKVVGGDIQDGGGVKDGGDDEEEDGDWELL